MRISNSEHLQSLTVPAFPVFFCSHFLSSNFEYNPARNCHHTFLSCLYTTYEVVEYSYFHFLVRTVSHIQSIFNFKFSLTSQPSSAVLFKSLHFEYNSSRKYQHSSLLSFSFHSAGCSIFPFLFAYVKFRIPPIQLSFFFLHHHILNTSIQVIFSLPLLFQHLSSTSFQYPIL